MAMSALGKKLVRDMRRSGMQFFAIVMLCSLGTFMFAGLDGTARLAQGTIDTYFAQNNLADFWVSVPSADRDTLERIRAISGVSDVCARATAELESTLPGEPTLNVTAYDGPMRINQPLVVEGEALSQTDSRGCLIQAGFAEVHGLSVGDRVSVKLSGQEYGFVVRGVVYSPEFICVTDGVYPNPDQYGYILINTCGMPDLPMTQVLVKLADGVDAQQAEKAITAALPAALVVNRGAHQSTANAQSNADMFANLTLVFPLIAYAVAALIVMTTLTRMIENQRMQLGTLKALGYPSRIEIVVPLLTGILLLVIGNYLPKTKQSYTMGIKLPWTLQSEENWTRTHRLSGFLWVLCGLVMIPLSLLRLWSGWLFGVLLAVMVLIPAVYSYALHRKGI